MQRNHIIIEWFGLEGTLKIIKFQPPFHGQEHLPLDQVVQSSFQHNLKHFKRWGTQCLTTLTVKYFFLMFNLNLLIFYFKPIPSCLIPTVPDKESLSNFPVDPL